MDKNRYKNASQKGFALLLSLLISGIVAFALAVELLNRQLNQKNMILTREQDQLFYTIEKNMQYGMSHSEFYNNCLFSSSQLSDPNEYPTRLLQKNISGCVIQEKSILLNSVTEDLGGIPCMNIEKIEKPENLLQVAHFYRMSVLGQNSQGNQIILQIVYAIPDIHLVDSCSTREFKTIEEGRQSWRIFSRNIF